MLKKEVLKVGYFTHTNISPSETFIYDLVKGLYQDIEINLTFVSGKTKKINVDFNLKSISTGFSDRNKKLSYNAYKLGQILGGRGYSFKQAIQHNSAKKSLKKANLDKFDVAYVEYATSGVLLMDYFVENKIPFIVHTHGYDVTAARSDYEYSKKLKILFECASIIITPSYHIKRYLILLGCKAEKIEVIYPFSVSDAIEPNLWRDRKKYPPSITFLGRLTEKKNPLALIYAFNQVVKKFSNLKLNILGDGELLDECLLLVKKLDLNNNVHFFGVVDRKIAFQTLCTTQIYVQHSVTSITGDQEGFPVSLAEAAAHELPLVSTIHSGITENILDGKTGFLVQEYDYETMAEKIIFLLENPKIAEEMGKEGRRHILQICNSETRVEKIKKLLKEVSSGKTKC